MCYCCCCFNLSLSSPLRSPSFPWALLWAIWRPIVRPTFDILMFCSESPESQMPSVKRLLVIQWWARARVQFPWKRSIKVYFQCCSQTLCLWHLISWNGSQLKLDRLWMQTCLTSRTLNTWTNLFFGDQTRSINIDMRLFVGTKLFVVSTECIHTHTDEAEPLSISFRHFPLVAQVGRWWSWGEPLVFIYGRDRNLNRQPLWKTVFLGPTPRGSTRQTGSRTPGASTTPSDLRLTGDRGRERLQRSWLHRSEVRSAFEWRIIAKALRRGSDKGVRLLGAWEFVQTSLRQWNTSEKQGELEEHF